MAGIADVSDQSFAASVLESDVPVLVDFFGDHCPACRQIAPILREIAEERASGLKVVQIHAAENPQRLGDCGLLMAISGRNRRQELTTAYGREADIRLPPLDLDP